MTTKISKILVVFVTTASIAFMATALAIRNTGPSWLEETQNLPEYGFARSDGENPQWSSTYRKDGQALATSPSLANVIAKSYDDAARRNQEEIGQLTPQIQPIANRIQEMTGYTEADSQGIKNREEQLVAAMKQIEQQLQDVSEESERHATQAVEIRFEAERTRESGMRLSRQRAQIETELYRLTAQKRQLLDLIYQMEGILQRLRDREQQLLDQGADPSASAPPADTSST